MALRIVDPPQKGREARIPTQGLKADVAGQHEQPIVAHLVRLLERLESQVAFAE